MAALFRGSIIGGIDWTSRTYPLSDLVPCVVAHGLDCSVGSPLGVSQHGLRRGVRGMTTRTEAPGHGTPLRRLNRELDRHRRRASRAWRKYQATSETVDPDTAAALHRVWSEATDDALQTADAISRQRPLDLRDLLIQYEAMWWWIKEDDNILDGSTRRWFGLFRRNLRVLVASLEKDQSEVQIGPSRMSSRS